MKSTIISSFLILLIAFHAHSGQIVTWTDENGVTHVEYVTNESDYKSKIKAHKVRLKSEQEERDERRKKLKEEHNQRLKKTKRATDDKIAKDRKEREKELERKRLERKIEQARKDYEYEKSQEEEYRDNYRDAYSKSLKKFWKEKLDGIYEAQKKYETLKHRRFQLEN